MSEYVQDTRQAHSYVSGGITTLKIFIVCFSTARTKQVTGE